MELELMKVSDEYLGCDTIKGCRETFAGVWAQ